MRGTCATRSARASIALALDADEPQLFVTVSDDLVARGTAASALVQAGAPVIDGKGGGRPEMAQARGTRRDRHPSGHWPPSEAARGGLGRSRAERRGLLATVPAAGGRGGECRAAPHSTSGRSSPRRWSSRSRMTAAASCRASGARSRASAHMQSGTVADIDAVVDNCQIALQEAEEMAGYRPSQVVIGIAGELVKGFTTSHVQERKRPGPADHARPSSRSSSTPSSARRSRRRSAPITWETGLPNVDIRLVHAAVTGAQIDGYVVTNPVGFQGRNVRISIFNAFAPLVHLGALQTVASRLDLELLAVVAEPYAVATMPERRCRCSRRARCSSMSAAARPMWRWSARAASRARACSRSGGRAFTKSLADRLDLPFQRAEEIKVDFARGLPIEQADEVERIVAERRPRLGGRRRARARGVRRAASCCPAGSTSAVAGRACRSSRTPLATQFSRSIYPSADRPRSRSSRHPR